MAQPDPDALVPLTTALNYFEAETIAQVLRAEDIPAFVQSNAATALGWSAPINATEIAVQVRQRDLERARLILDTNKQDSVDIDWSEVDVGDPVDPMTGHKPKAHAAVKQATFIFKWAMLIPYLFFLIAAIGVGLVGGLSSIPRATALAVIVALAGLLTYALIRGKRSVPQQKIGPKGPPTAL
ncbi:MAG TPA: hypothetical protein VG797_02195 [Phycisphaerales bacterium]|nr:hypothetical protein [Phycisphaerales bacterium]